MIQRQSGFKLRYIRSREYFWLHDQNEISYVYKKEDRLAYSERENYNIDAVKVYLYQTVNNTIAINFDAYYRFREPYNWECLHFYLDKPFDTGIRFETAAKPFSIPLKYQLKFHIEETQLKWKCTKVDAKHYSKNECACSLIIDADDSAIHFVFDGEWLEYISGEKYPIYMKFKFDTNWYPYCQQYCFLNTVEASTEPMIVPQPIYYKEKPSVKQPSFVETTDSPCEKQTASYTPPHIHAEGDSMIVDIIKDMDEKKRKEYEAVFDIPNETKIIHYDTLGVLGKYSDDGPDLIFGS